MRQVRITTKDLDYPTNEDCILSPDDPIHELKNSLMVGGLGMHITVMNQLFSELMNNKEK